MTLHVLKLNIRMIIATQTQTQMKNRPPRTQMLTSTNPDLFRTRLDTIRLKYKLICLIRVLRHFFIHSLMY